jgi:hypothetical protein
MQIDKSFTVDLAGIEGRGDFKYPKWEVRISPDGIA